HLQRRPAGLEGDARRVPCRLPGREPAHPGEHQRHHPLPGGRRHPGGGLIMATGHFKVVTADKPDGQSYGEIALHTADGTAWVGGGEVTVDAADVTATAVGEGTATDVQGVLEELEARIAALEALQA